MFIKLKTHLLGSYYRVENPTGSNGQRSIRTNVTMEYVKAIGFSGVSRPERATLNSVGRSPTKWPITIFSPERATRIKRTPLQGLNLMHFIEGLRPSLMRVALSGQRRPANSLKKVCFLITLVRMGRSPTNRSTMINLSPERA